MFPFCCVLTLSRRCISFHCTVCTWELSWWVTHVWQDISWWVIHVWQLHCWIDLSLFMAFNPICQFKYHVNWFGFAAHFHFCIYARMSFTKFEDNLTKRRRHMYCTRYHNKIYATKVKIQKCFQKLSFSKSQQGFISPIFKKIQW